MQNFRLILLVLLFSITWVDIILAQCTFNLNSTVVSHSSCMANGSIKVDVSGSNIDLTDVQITLKSSSGNTVISTNASQLFEFLEASTYTITVKAKCRANQLYATNQTTTVITTSYKAPVVQSGALRKSLNCIPTGLFSLPISEGLPPYQFRMTSSPLTYNGSRDFTLANPGTFTLDDLPSGKYEFTITDACSYSQNRVVNITNVSSDFPADPFFLNAYPTIPPESSCQQVIALAKDAAVELDYYWNQNRARYYDIAISTDGTKNWIGATNDDKFTVNLPYSYKEMRDNFHMLTVHLRIKGATCERQADVIVAAQPTMQWQPETMCGNYRVNFGPFLHNPIKNQNESFRSLICYPYNWEVFDDTQTRIEHHTGVSNSNRQQTTTVFQDNKAYVLRITDSNGDIINLNIKASGLSVVAKSSFNGCLPDPKLTTMELTANVPFPIGTRIQFISGPTQPIHRDVTLTAASSSFYPFSSNSNDISYSNILPGKYIFKITDPCGKVYDLSYDQPEYEIRGFTYTTKINCSELLVYPEGVITWALHPQVSYFKMIKAPPGVDIRNSYFQSGTNGHFKLSVPGHYVFDIRTSRPEVPLCSADTLGVDFSTNNLEFSQKSAYICTAGGTGTIQARAKNGKLPYTYTLLKNALPIPGIPSNTIGDFTYGAAGENLTIHVRDSCGSAFSVDVQVINLQQEQLIKVSDTVCIGESIELESVNLGSLTYQWTGPNGFTSTQQNATINNAQIINSGTYTMQMQPLGCNSLVTKSLVAKVYLPPPPISNNVSYCHNATATALNATALRGHRLLWYSTDSTALPQAPTPNTTNIGVQQFKVQQQLITRACMSTFLPVQASIIAQPLAPIATGVACHLMNPTLHIKDVHPGTYKIFAERDLTTPIYIHNHPTNNILLSILVTTALPTDTVFYVEVTVGNCTSARTKVEVVLTRITLEPTQAPNIIHDQFYSVQFTSNAINPEFSHIGILPPGLSLNSTGLLSGTVPTSAGMQNKTITVFVSENSARGCRLSKPINLRTCEPAPIIPVQPFSYCQNDIASPLQATVLPNLSLQWYASDMVTRLPNAPTPNTNVVGMQRFYVAQVNATLNCEGTKALIEIQINPLPAIDFTSFTTPVCAGQSAIINLAHTHPNLTYSAYLGQQLQKSIQASGNTSSIDVGIPLFQNTTYTLQITDLIGCSSIIGQAIEVPVMDLDLNPDKLPACTKGVPYSVQFNSTAINPYFELASGILPSGLNLNQDGLLSGKIPVDDQFTSTTFTVQVTDINNCVKQKTYTLTGSTFIPNVITPNGDGKNDVFMRGKKVIIFDRLGIVIHEGPDGWDGTYKGNKAPADTYYYLLDDEGEQKKGFITLIR